jgi:hypothetical protein
MEKLGMNGEKTLDYYVIADAEDLSFYENKQF